MKIEQGPNAAETTNFANLPVGTLFRLVGDSRLFIKAVEMTGKRPGESFMVELQSGQIYSMGNPPSASAGHPLKVISDYKFTVNE